MSVNGLTFLAFLLLSVLLYYIVPKKARWTVLFAASIVFYLSYSISAALYLVLTIAFTYVFSLVLGSLAVIKPTGDTPDEKRANKKKLTHKKRAVLSVALVVNFATLAVLKYSGFFITNINNVFSSAIPLPRFLLPLGISFYIFQTSGYLIDVYRGKYKPQRNILKYALFVSYFPQMVQGPINRYDALEIQLYPGNSFDIANIQNGILRMMFGVLKKALIADSLALVVSSIYTDYTNYPGVIVFCGAALYCIQLYADFSGGVDLLCGASRLFGVTMQENFAQPYFATSLSDFWRRWHISLGEWMKDYLFYPLALSKAFSKITKKSRKIFPAWVAKRVTPCLATFIVFLAVGVWQGPGWANIAYGLWNGTLMSLALLWVPISSEIASRFSLKINSGLSTAFAIIRTNILVIIGRYFSNSSSLGQALGMLRQTVTHPDLDGVTLSLFENLGFTPANVTKIVLALVALFCISLAKERGVDVVKWFCSRKWYFQLAVMFVCLFIIVFAVYANAGYTPIAYVYENV